MASWYRLIAVFSIKLKQPVVILHRLILPAADDESDDVRQI